MTTRSERAAQNENLFREINERVEELSRALDELDIVCECSDGRCVERIPGVPVPEYEGVRRHADRFLVLRGHESPDLETVVADRRRYLVVAKHGAAGQVAREADPRAE